MRPFGSCRCDTRHRVGGHRRCIGIGSQLLSYRNNDVASLFGCWPFAQNSEIQAQPCVKEAGDRNAGWINILIRLGIVFSEPPLGSFGKPVFTGLNLLFKTHCSAFQCGLLLLWHVANLAVLYWTPCGDKWLCHHFFFFFFGPRDSLVMGYDYLCKLYRLS